MIGADDVVITRADMDADVSRALIGSLDQELSAMYPEPGANHFSLGKSEVAEGHGAFLVVYRDGDAVGCGALRLLDAATAELKRMYVMPSVRGTGLGKRLVAALEAEARTLGVRHLVLETGVRQEAALALYRVTGFRSVPLFGEYRLSPETSVCLGKTLIDSRYTIAPARVEDLRHLARIERAAAEMLRGHAPDSVIQETTSDAALAQARAAGRLWVALASGAPVGFALVEMLAPDLPHLDEIDVDPAHARQGLGAALIRAVCEWASRCGHRELTLTTFRDVAWNTPYYARLGFVEVVDGELRAELRAVLEDEAARGLERRARVAMTYRIRSRRSDIR